MALEKNRRGLAALVAAAAAFSASLVLAPNVAKAAVTGAVTGNASFSTTVEASGAFGTSSFEAAGNTADGFPAFGAVAFSETSFAAIAGSGILPAATLSLPEFTSGSTATMTHAGSVIDIYFAEAPTTTTAGLGDYDTTNEPGGFDASTFNADLVGVDATYLNVAGTTDTVLVTLSTADVTFIDNSITNGAGTFEFFAVATTAGSSARFDGNFATTPAMLTLTAAPVIVSTPEPASVLLLGSALAPLALGRRRANRRTTGATVR